MKKLIIFLLAAAMLGFFGVAQAASDLPDILGAVETNAYQTMSDEEMNAIEGAFTLRLGIFSNPIVRIITPDPQPNTIIIGTPQTSVFWLRLRY
jgi:hypothetical protein